MKKIFELVLALFTVLVFTSCEEEGGKPDPGPSGGDSSDIVIPPFENVPATGEIVMYEVNPKVFSNMGNLQGVENRLDEIKDLGINVVWLMPVYPTGEENSVGSPYAVKDYRSVHPDYGTMEDLKSLVYKAHERDMAVILDWVANHTAWDNPWIENRDWYEQDANGNITHPNGWQDVAELNFDNPGMRAEMISAMKFWVEEVNIDGYRCDYADGVPFDFWQQAMDTLYSIPGRELIMFAEGTRNDHYAAGFDLTFGWHYYDRLSRIYNDNLSAETLIEAHEEEYSGLAEGDHVLRFIDNHDFNAWDHTPLKAFNGEEGATTAFAITALMGGVPLIYNGQEVACDQQLPFFEGHNVTIDWSANPEVLAEYKQLVDIRTSYEAFSKGGLQYLDGGEDVVVFSRTAGDEQLFVVANVRNRAVLINTPSEMAVDNLTNVVTGEAYDLAYSIELEAYEYVVLK